MFRTFLSTALVHAALLLPSVLGFGVTTSGNNLNVDTSAGLTFTVDRTTGDVTSILFNGIQAQDQSGKHSQISSGIGASCSSSQPSSNIILITCTTSTLTQYYLARNGDPAIHMATFTTAEPSVGELRYIARLNRATLPNGFPQSDVNGGTAIEGSDVFLLNGQTRSKFYSSRQFIDDAVKGVSGNGIAAWMIVPGTGFEASSGGPFFRDIDNQGSAQQELYFYMVCAIFITSITNTEISLRTLDTPTQTFSARVCTAHSSTPATFDTSFWAGLPVTGFVAQSGRGRVTGQATGFQSQFNSLISIGWSNSNNQYWVRTDTSGRFTSPFMKPGTYTMTLYSVELALASQSVSVSAGGTTTSNIASTFSFPATIWQIGDLDGTPRGFLNADKIETMHPSDTRMSNWGPVTFTVGQAVSSFPMAIFQAVGSVTIHFTLSSSQGGARTLDIFTTLAFAGARPQITLNSFTGAIPAIPNQPDSRGVTRGTWRGNNIQYSVAIPSGTLKTDGSTNVLTINAVSGSSGAGFLSPNLIFDSIRLH
ncbi:hypothetical protein D9758_010904 [Tetrapyrgos nigripes]|uniref:rhamnogalacturonan endolyase n=1 Tax=Tetrapyrgos nigripes TaxID=182062 RepID=A0A8H5CUS2_9AGAR|nr:hypothetical protein D9758_010904 [Tetrapyrgos nigripes]